MKKEKHLWLKKLKFLLGVRTSKEEFVDLIKYSPLWFFKYKVKSYSVCINNEEAAKLLIAPDYNDKLLIYTEKHILGDLFFGKFLCKNGSKEQLLEVAKSPFFSYADIEILIKRFDDDFLELFFKKLKNPISVSSYNAGDLVNCGYEKSLIAWLNSLDKKKEKNVFALWFDRRSFETLLCNSNLEKAKELYFDFSELTDVARLYIINSKNQKRIEQILEKQCKIDECIALLKTNDASLEMLAVKKYLENEYDSNDFINILLETGNLTAIKEYLKHKALDKEKELFLVKNVDDEIIKFYILENENIDILSDVAMQYVFENRSSDLQEFIYSNMGLPYIQERNLIKSLDEEKICAYTSKFDLFVANECLLISTASKEIIEKYLSCNDLSESAEFCLIRRNEKDITNKYLNLLLQKENTEDKKLSRKALTEFISIGDIDDIINYLQSRDVCTYFTAKQSLLRGDEKLIEIHQKMLNSDIVREVSKEAETCVLVKLFNNKNVKFGCYAQCDFCSREDIMLNTTSDLIVNRNFDDDIKFVKSTKILPPIAEFVKNYPLCAKAQELLFDDKFFNENVIRLYISLYELDENVLSSIINNAKFKDILNEYMEIHPLSDKLIRSMLN
ncbi:MAG: hypothetical protein IKW58_01360 [Alphaproteobacteria bacterium]|nr:hypothetical protein [Alphaproteobacteria bacterium]